MTLNLIIINSHDITINKRCKCNNMNNALSTTSVKAIKIALFLYTFTSISSSGLFLSAIGERNIINTIDIIINIQQHQLVIAIYLVNIDTIISIITETA